MKPILVPKMNLNTLVPKIKKDIAGSTKVAKQKMVKTTIKFNRVSPDFIIDRAKEIKGDLISLTGPRDNKDGLIWLFLNEGTAIRYAVMTPDFIPKTIPGTLTTVSGAGGLSHFDFKNPRPGIEARMWTHIIAKIEGKKFQKKVIKTVKQFTKKLF